MTVTSAIKNR